MTGALLLGCGGSSTPSTAGATAGVGDLHVSLERPRYLVVSRKVEIILRNQGANPISVDTLQLTSEAFEAVEPTLRSVDVPPGQRVDVPVPYGEARCGNDITEHTVRLGIGGSGPQEWELEDADEAIGLLHSEECHRQAVEAAADIDFGMRWRQLDERSVRTTLVVRRAESPDRIVVDEIRGGVIWSLKTLGPQRTPALALPEGEDEAEVDVQLGILRCDPHGMAESKKTYRFPIYVSLGEAEAQYLEVEPTGSGRALLERMLDDCANG
ncbi:MAG: hypothetical protein GEU74_16885 [Nitriliruptorales bacterium]|nr:hypothetical protein [Nitriliruptorales bacterium]